MTDRDEQPSLDALVATLEGTFPAQSDLPLAITLLRLLAKGRPVSAAALADAAGRGPAATGRVLGRWPNVELDATRSVVAFSGLTQRPTAHRFDVAGQPLHAWCAWDTLFLPALLGEPANVRSTCPVTGADVQLEVTPNGVTRAQPAELSVSFPPLATTDAADITGSFCCHVHFLAGAAAAEQWRERHPDGIVIDLQTAYELGRRGVPPFSLTLERLALSGSGERMVPRWRSHVRRIPTSSAARRSRWFARALIGRSRRSRRTSGSRARRCATGCASQRSTAVRATA